MVINNYISFIELNEELNKILPILNCQQLPQNTRTWFHSQTSEIASNYTQVLLYWQLSEAYWALLSKLIFSRFLYNLNCLHGFLVH